MDIILSAQNVHVGNIVSYQDINILRHQSTFLCGESGCGKSTLLRLFNATQSPSDGILTYNNHPISEMDTVALRSQIILVSQSVFLFDGTIAENFDQYYRYRDMPALAIDEQKKFLSICCADFDDSALCERMSGGERQRVFTAICLSFLPNVLMLDEPTSALDTATAEQFFYNIKKYCIDNGITIITVSHDLSLAKRYADEIIMLEKRKS